MASVSARDGRTNKRAHKISGAAGVRRADNPQEPRRQRRTLPSRLTADLPAASEPASPPDVDSPSTSIEDQLDLLWSQLQRQMLELLTHGIAAPFQQRTFDKLDYAMKQCGKLRRERAEDPRSAARAEPDADEVAAILDKMDRRIDALAEERFKKLAQRELHAPGTDGSRAGMDV